MKQKSEDQGLLGLTYIFLEQVFTLIPQNSDRDLLSSKKISECFVSYFSNLKSHPHTFVPSSSLIPQNDNSILFTNAGMNQFKNVFLGIEPRPYMNAVSVQKCVRAGGKHNDLDNVGYTARHHTFFHMLGNFSFGGQGSYFKKDAIHYAWNFLVNGADQGGLGLNFTRLYVTVYHTDDESYGYWQEILQKYWTKFYFLRNLLAKLIETSSSGLTELHDILIESTRSADEEVNRRIIRITEKADGSCDNFWAMGDTGPCGPCTEIFYDNGDMISGGLPGTAEEDGDRFVEIWNLVFMQYNRDSNGKLHNLPNPCVDTGMGLERITAVKQTIKNCDKRFNEYDISEIANIKELQHVLLALFASIDCTDLHQTTGTINKAFNHNKIIQEITEFTLNSSDISRGEVLGYCGNYDSVEFIQLKSMIQALTEPEKKWDYDHTRYVYKNSDGILSSPVTSGSLVSNKIFAQSLIALNVLADHMRTICYLLSEGLTPSSNDRGYVLRAIMRRMIKYAYLYLLEEYNSPLLYKLFDHSMLNHLFTINPDATIVLDVQNIVKQEEASFLEILIIGQNMILNYMDNNKSSDKTLDGEFLFILQDRHGVPLDVTQDIAYKHSYKIDLEAYNNHMQKAQELSKQGQKFTGTNIISSIDQMSSQDNVDFIDENNIFSQLIYDAYALQSDTTQIETTASIKAIFTLDDLKEQEQIVADNQYMLVLSDTIFYAESGGQIGDRGKILFANNSQEPIVFNVEDTRYFNTVDGKKVIAHIGILETIGTLATKSKLLIADQATSFILNPKQRIATTRNHTATHLLHAILRKMLGNHVEQKGSLVSDKQLRFDFSHDQALTNEQLHQIEHEINRYIALQLPVTVAKLNKDEAQKAGYMGLFDYQSEVRCIAIGSDTSKELCGGCHLDNTGQILAFKVISDKSIAKGIRRIIALTGENAIQYCKNHVIILENLKHEYKVNLPAEEYSVEDLSAISGKIAKQYQDIKQNQQQALDYIQQLDQFKLIGLVKNAENYIYSATQLATIVSKVDENLRAVIKVINNNNKECNWFIHNDNFFNYQYMLSAFTQFKTELLKDKLQLGVIISGSINGLSVIMIAWNKSTIIAPEFFIELTKILNNDTNFNWRVTYNKNEMAVLIPIAL